MFTALALMVAPVSIQTAPTIQTQNFVSVKGPKQPHEQIRPWFFPNHR